MKNLPLSNVPVSLNILNEGRPGPCLYTTVARNKTRVEQQMLDGSMGRLRIQVNHRVSFPPLKSRFQLLVFLLLCNPTNLRSTPVADAECQSNFHSLGHRVITSFTSSDYAFQFNEKLI